MVVGAEVPGALASIRGVWGDILGLTRPAPSFTGVLLLWGIASVGAGDKVLTAKTFQTFAFLRHDVHPSFHLYQLAFAESGKRKSQLLVGEEERSVLPVSEYIVLALLTHWK